MTRAPVRGARAAFRGFATASLHTRTDRRPSPRSPRDERGCDTRYRASAMQLHSGPGPAKLLTGTGRRRSTALFDGEVRRM